MSNKSSSVVKLIGNKLFIVLLVFAIAIIMISAVLNRNSQELAQNGQDYEEETPVVSETEVYEPVDVEPVVEEVIPTVSETTPVEDVMEVEYTMPLTGELQREFSVDELLWDDTMQDWRTHNGIDIASDVGTEVDTAAAGKVIDAYKDETYGFVVKVQHADGVVTVYKNLEKIVVDKDDILDQGQMIGTVGNKGAFEIAQKPHLHFEVIVEDKNINPLDLIK